MWAKIDDQWFCHPKTVGLSLAARGLWATVLSWTCSKRTPHVPEHMAPFLAGGEDITDLAAELVKVGKWHGPGHDCEDCDDIDSGWVVHHWAEYQELTTSEKRSRAGRKGGKASAKTRQQQAEPKQNEANAKQNEATMQANGEANPKQTSKQVSRTRTQDQKHDAPPDGDASALEERREERDRQFEQFWDTYPRHHETGRKGGGATRSQAEKRWRKMKPGEREDALAAVDNYAAELKQTGQYPAHATTWLNQRRWETYEDPPPGPQTLPDGRRNIGGVLVSEVQR